MKRQDSCRRVVWALAILLLIGAAAARSRAGDVRINEVGMTNLGPQWVELHNTGAAPASLQNHVLSDEDGSDYTIPALLPDVPAGAFVVIVFDGTGPAGDDYDFGDNVATLHSLPGQLMPFGPTGDQASLYSSNVMTVANIVSFVAWGDLPGDDAANAVAAGLWPGNRAIILSGPGGSTELPQGPVPTIAEGGSIGAFGQAPPTRPAGWSIYSPESASPGDDNGLPPVSPHLPIDGTESTAGDFAFSWIGEEGDSAFDIQVCLDPECTQIVVEALDLVATNFTPDPALDPGEYFWRVRASAGVDGKGPWSASLSFEVLFADFEAKEGFEIGRNGGRRGRGGGGGEAANAAGNISGKITDVVSDNPLSGVTITLAPGGLNAVTNASGNYVIANVPNGTYNLTATLANYGNLTANNLEINNNNITNLNGKMRGKNKVIGVAARAARKDTRLLCLDGCQKNNNNNRGWDASHTAAANWWTHERNHCPYTMCVMLSSYYGGTVTIDEIANNVKGNDGDPADDLAHDDGCMPAETQAGLKWSLQTNQDGDINYTETKPTDAAVIALIDANRPCGYGTPPHLMVLDGYYYVDKNLWIRLLNTDNNGKIDWVRYSTYAFRNFMAPKAGLVGRATNPTVATDADGDGIMDFDEDHRFPTSKNDVDSDDDCVRDKIEIVSYIFPNPNRATDADADGDGMRAEADEDGDEDGCKDGQEDTNRDGILQADAGETDPFDDADFYAAGDLDDDCDVDDVDFDIFLSAFASSFGDDEYIDEADYNFSGQIDLEDFQIWYGYYARFNAPCP